MDEIQQQQELLATHRKRLAVLLKQLAIYGEADAPPNVITDIDAARADIQRIKAFLRKRRIAVEDLPGDTAQVARRLALWHARSPRTLVAAAVPLIVIILALGLLRSVAIWGNGNITNTGPGSITINQGDSPDVQQQKLDPTIQMESGHTVRSEVGSWTVVISEAFANDVPYLYLGHATDDRAASNRVVKDGHYSLTMESHTNATEMAGFHDVTPPLKDFYVTATVTKLPGPSDSQCGIIFGYQDIEYWLFFRLQDAGTFSLSQDRGGIPHLRIAGPYANAAIHTNGPNTLSIIAQNGTYRFFVNDIEVHSFSSDTVTIPTGTFDLGIQTPNLPGVVTCVFDDFEVRTPRK